MKSVDYVFILRIDISASSFYVKGLVGSLANG